MEYLNTAVLRQYMTRAQEYLRRRPGEPEAWRSVAGFGDQLVHCTAQELACLQKQIEALLAPYAARNAPPGGHPPGSRAVQIIQLAIPFPEARSDDHPANVPADDSSDASARDRAGENAHNPSADQPGSGR
jgi:hypothetical protein